MHIKRFLRDSRAYLHVSSVVSLRRDLDGHGQIWRAQAPAQASQCNAMLRSRPFG